MSNRTPPDTRPYRPAHESGDEMVTEAPSGRWWSRQTWRQIGWHGQSGAFYSLDEDPSPYERGSFSPLWLLVENEPVIVITDDEEMARHA